MSQGVAHGISRHRRGVTPAPHSCLREESTGLCCRGVLHLGRAFCGLCLGSRVLARLPLALTLPSRGPRGPTGDLALHSSLAASSHFLPSSRFCAQGTFGYLSGLLLTILFL